MDRNEETSFPCIIDCDHNYFMVVFYQQLPAQVPIHWDLNGVANGYATKFNALLMNVSIMILLYVLLIFLPKIDPKSEKLPKIS